VAAAAYRSGERLRDDYIGKTHDYTDRQDVVHKCILLPDDAPREFLDRQTLVRAIDEAENRSDSRTAREIKIALPIELSFEDQVALVEDYVQGSFITLGMCADIAIHKGTLDEHRKPRGIEPVFGRRSNPHAHILLTTRMVDREGFVRTKCRDWDNRKYAPLWRREWADAMNSEFERLGLPIRVSHESLAAQGVNREPTKHLGPTVMALELRGVQTNRGDEYRETMSRNKERDMERQRRRERDKGRDRELNRERTREPERSR